LAASTSFIRLLHALALVAVLALAAAGTAAAGSTSTCGKQVIDDWYDDGRVDGRYALRCYDDAIKALPRDVRDYSSAKEDITAALNAARRGDPAPPATTDPTPGEPVSNVQDPDDFDGDGVSNEDDPTPGVQRDLPNANPDEPDEGDDEPEVIGDVDTSRSDSLPLPLLVLAGLALLLVAAGTAAYLVRRLQARRLPPTP
jgi:hypothetical protein